MIPECVGTVLKIYKKDEWDNILDRPTGRLLPESEWSVAVHLETLPQSWPYEGTHSFAATVKNLRRA